VLWAEYADVATLDEHGEIVAIDGVVRDVTERVALERELRASEERQRAVIEALPDMVFRLDADGIYREFIRAEGSEPLVDPALFIGRAIGDVMPEPVATQASNAVRAALESRRPQRIEYGLEMDGEERVYEARIVPVRDDEVLAFVRDFTAEHRVQREDERREERARLEGEVEQRMGQRNPYGLTFREFTVLHHVARGAADKEIAEALGISAYTVNKHVASILSKMGVPSRTAAGVQAVRDGVIA
jgi:DNA-binding CsgD family transcriptional regulator